MKMLVCGSRYEPHWTGRAIVKKQMSLHSNFRHEEEVTVIHGAAPGVDTLAGEYAEGSWGWTVRAYPAKWDEHGKKAGPLRNQQMLDEEPGIDLVLAFPDDQSRGTWDMVERAVKARIPVRVYPITVER